MSGTTSRISGLRVPSSSSRPLLVPRPPSLRLPPPPCAPRAEVEVFDADALADVAAACAFERSFCRAKLASLNLRRRAVGTHSSQLQKGTTNRQRERQGAHARALGGEGGGDARLLPAFVVHKVMRSEGV